MDKIKTVKVSSRRSSKIGEEYFTFEMTLEADVSGLTDKKEYISKLWEYAGEEVDNQLVETAKSIKK